MPTPVTLSYGVEDAKLDVITADPAGGTPTYETAIDIPGITKVTLSINISSKTLRGDNTQLDARSTISGVEGSIDFAKQSLDVLRGALGGAITTTGIAGTDEQTRWALTADSTPRAFRLRAITAAADPVNGNLKLTLAKCILKGFQNIGAQDDDFVSPSMSVDVVPLLSTRELFDLTVNEAAATLA